MSSRYQLTAQEITDLESAHRQTSDKRYADRLKTVYLLGKGWSVTQVAEVLMIDRETVRNHYKRYRKGGLSALQKFEVGGSKSFLNELQGKHWINICMKICIWLPKKLRIMSNKPGVSRTAKAA